MKHQPNNIFIIFCVITVTIFVLLTMAKTLARETQVDHSFYLKTEGTIIINDNLNQHGHDF